MALLPSPPDSPFLSCTEGISEYEDDNLFHFESDIQFETAETTMDSSTSSAETAPAESAPVERRVHGGQAFRAFASSYESDEALRDRARASWSPLLPMNSSIKLRGSKGGSDMFSRLQARRSSPDNVCATIHEERELL